MVDAVLYFEGEGGHHFRILRAVKNRFGPTDEIGVFEMTGAGLSEVANPSELFLGERNAATPGAAVFAGMEGTRPLLVEIQALVAPTALGTPRRAVVGWDQSRLAMVLAVLEAHCGVRLGDCDVYLNVAGGLRIAEPAADLAVAAALVSSRLDAPLPRGQRLFRRGQPVRRGAARSRSAGAAQGGAEARLSPRGAAGRPLPRTPRGPGARGVDQLAELVGWHRGGARGALAPGRRGRLTVGSLSACPHGYGMLHAAAGRDSLAAADADAARESC